jgi:hypothetical protein
MVMASAKTSAVAAGIIAFLGIVACTSQGDAQTLIDSKGAWQIETSPDTAVDKFSMSTLALDQSGAKISLACRKDAPVYYFSIEAARPSSPGMEEEARFSIRVANQDPIWFQTAWHGGGIEVREHAHETAFSIIMSLLAEPSAANVEFSVREEPWPFSLDGFLDARAALRQHCGDEVAPDRMPLPAE